MSVIVKGMKMPKNCIFCPISHWNKLDELTGCEIHQKHIPNTEKEFWEKDRPDWCHIVAVPTPHGRLIDADALKQKKKHSTEFAENVVSVAEIDWMPTIIEAEDET